MFDDLLDRFRRRDRAALARLLTLSARGQSLDEIRRAMGTPAKPGRVVAITGAGGVGKSTLVGKLIEEIRRRGQTVAVLACDPQSPISGGALLGDRVRMPSRPEDPEVFIRSLAAVSGNEGIADQIDTQVSVLEAFGFDVVLIETVGVGQGNVAVRNVADTVVLLVQPETGDDLQWEKAGILEVADVIAIHKADLPGADRLESQLRRELETGASSPVPLVRVSSKTGQGIAELWDAVAGRTSHRVPYSSKNLLLVEAQRSLARWYADSVRNGGDELRRLMDDFDRATVARDHTVAAMIALYARDLAEQAGRALPQSPSSTLTSNDH